MVPDLVESGFVARHAPFECAEEDGIEVGRGGFGVVVAEDAGLDAILEDGVDSLLDVLVAPGEVVAVVGVVDGLGAEFVEDAEEVVVGAVGIGGQDELEEGLLSFTGAAGLWWCEVGGKDGEEEVEEIEEEVVLAVIRVSSVCLAPIRRSSAASESDSRD